MSAGRALTGSGDHRHTAPIMTCTCFRSLHACMPALQVVFVLPEHRR